MHHYTACLSSRIRAVVSLLGAIGMLLACTPALHAQQDEPPVRIGMSVSSRQVSLGEPFILEVAAEGERDPGGPELSIPAEFRVRSLGPSRQSSTQQSIINGRITTSTRTLTAYRYELIARDTGSFTLPGATFTIDGADYITNSVAVRVTRPAPSDLLTVDADVSNTEPYAGQPVLITLSMLFRFDPGDLRITAPADLDGVVSAPVTEPAPNENTLQFLDEPTPYEAGEGMHRGRRGLMVRVERYIVPTRPGELAVGPISVSARAGGSVFSAGRTIVAVSDPLTISVRPLPREGRPTSFTGLVGELQLDTEITPASANVGDPMTLRAIVRTDLPQRIDAEDLRIEQTLGDDFQRTADPPETTFTRNAAIIELSIRPTHPGIDQLPPFELAFFDPATSEYSIARSAPIPLKIRAAREVGLADAVSADPIDPDVDTGQTLTDLDTGIAPSIARLGRLRTPSQGVLASVTSPLWIAAVATPPGIYLASFIAVRISRRRRSESARRRRALADAHKRIDTAQDPADLGVAIVDAIRAAANIPSQSLTPREAEQLVLARTGNTADAAALRDLLEHCDAARYAGISTTDSATDLRDDAQNLLRSLEPKLTRAARPHHEGSRQS